MSSFRDDINHKLITANGHPQRTHDTLAVLEEVLREKNHICKGSSLELGMWEAYCLIVNLRADMARDYGIIGEGN